MARPEKLRGTRSAHSTGAHFFGATLSDAGNSACRTRICIRESLWLSLRNFWHENLGPVVGRAGERVSCYGTGTYATSGTAAFAERYGNAHQGRAGNDSAFSVVSLLRDARGRLSDDNPARGRGFERLHGYGRRAPAQTRLSWFACRVESTRRSH